MSDNPGRFVRKVEDINTFNYVQPAGQNTAQYVHPMFYVSGPVRQVKVRGKGYAIAVRVPKPLGDVLRANPVAVASLTFLGKVGVAGSTTVVRGIRAPKAKMYVAPIPEQYSAVAQVVNKAIELTNSGVPWSAVMYGYRLGRGGQLKAILLLPETFQYVQEKRRAKGSAVRVNKVRIFLFQDLVPGFKVGETYQFHLELVRATAWL
jgi:hypothetical protein